MTVPFRNVSLDFGDARLSASNRGEDWMVESLSGWFGGVGVKGERTARLGHGDFFAPNQRTGRALTLNLLWVGEAGARDYVSRALSGLFSDGEEGALTATVGALELTANRVTLDGEVSVAEVGTVGVRAQIPLHVADPFLYSPARETNLRPVGAGVGLEFPAFRHVAADRVNVVVNHSFESDLAGWSGFRADLARVPHESGFAARITSTTDTDSSSLLESSIGTSAHPVTPGQMLTVSYDVVEEADRSVDSLAYYYDATGAFMWNVVSTDAAVVGGVKARPVVVFEVPAGAAFVRFLLARANRPLGASADIDNISVEIGSEATSGNYFGAASSEPVVVFGSAVGATDWVWNDGNAEAFPVFVVTADAPGGFAVGLGDSRVTYPWPVSPDMPVRVDMRGSLSVSGVDQSHLLGGRGWSSAPPSSISTPFFELLQGGTGFCVVEHRDVYL